MARYIEETDVYKLVEPRGVAKVHCSQIDELPRADVVKVVRCGKCEYWDTGVCYNETQKYLFTHRSHYCGYGTKRKCGE